MMAAYEERVNDPGWIEVRQIIVGVSVTIYPHGIAELNINERSIIRFKWTVEAALLFENIDIAEPIELLELLSRLDTKFNGEGDVTTL